MSLDTASVSQPWWRVGANNARGAHLSTFEAGRGEQRLALAVVLLSVAVFAAAAPFAALPLPPLPAFLPIYQSALVINELITAVLLFGQFGILRSRALLVLACAYLFSAVMAVAHLMSFPGLFAPGGLLGAGSQTTAWIYFLWHGGFPLLVVLYALLKDAPGPVPPGKRAVAVAAGVAAVLVAAGALTALTTLGHDALPVIMSGDSDAATKTVVAAVCWALSLAALAVMWRRRSRTLIDLWLMVTLCVWIFEIALAAVLNHARFDLGWYVGRVYGLLAGSFVLMALLLENGFLHARVREHGVELEAANRELEAFSYSVSHDLRAPLRAVHGYAQMLDEDHGARLDEEGRRLLGVVRASAEQMGRLIDDLLKFSQVGRRALARSRVDMRALAAEAIGELVPAYPQARVELGALPEAVGDRALLRHVWVNLIGNALKYSARAPEPSVEVSGRVEGAECFYSVRDNGAGFDMRYYDKLFNVFQRLHREDEFEGTGVGLAIVQRVIARHGGRVWAEGAVGAGAAFHFALPAEAAL